MKIWMDRREHDEKLAVLTETGFLVDDSSDTDFDHAQKAIEAGEEPANVLSKEADVIPLAGIRRVESEPANGSLTIHYQKGKDKDSEFWVFESPQRRDEIVGALQQQLGNDFKTYVDAYTPLRAAFAPLMTLSVTWLLTFIFHDIAVSMSAGESVDTSGRNSTVKKLVAWLLELFGPTGVVVIGYLVTAICLWKLYTRTTNPPIIHWLQAVPHVPATGWRLGVRYAIFFAVSAVTLRAIFTG